MRKVIRFILLSCSVLAFQNVSASESIPASECRISSDGDDAECNVKNRIVSYDIVCNIEIVGTTRKGVVLKNEQKRTISPGKYVIQHVKNFGDYSEDPIIKVEGFTRCQ